MSWNNKDHAKQAAVTCTHYIISVHITFRYALDYFVHLSVFFPSVELHCKVSLDFSITV